jgi:hypothetical protein
VVVKRGALFLSTGNQDVGPISRTSRKWPTFGHNLILPDIFAVGVIGLADAVRLKYIFAPFEPVLLLEGILVGRFPPMEQMAFNPFDLRLQGKCDSTNKEQHHEDCRAWLGFFLGSATRSMHGFYLSVCPFPA